MSLSVSINLEVPDLPDNDVAFSNNSSWVNYWSRINLTGTFDPAENNLYVESAFNNNLLPVTLVQEGVETQVPSQAQFASLLLAYQTLNTSYKELRDKLKALGLLEESQ